MRGFSTNLANREQQYSNSVGSRWQYRPSLEVLDERLAPSAVTANGALAVLRAPQLAPATTSTAVLAGRSPLLYTLSYPTVTPAILVSLMANPDSRLLQGNPLPMPVVTVGAPTPAPFYLLGSGGYSSMAEATLTLSNVPVQMMVTEDETLIFTASADYDGRPAQQASFSLERVEGGTFPEGADFDAQTGRFIWTPTVGLYTFRVRVRDGNNTAVQLVRFRVTAAMKVSPAIEESRANKQAAPFLEAGPTPIEPTPPALETADTISGVE